MDLFEALMLIYTQNMIVSAGQRSHGVFVPSTEVDESPHCPAAASTLSADTHRASVPSNQVTQRRQGIRHVREQQLVAGVSSTGSLQDFLEHYDLI